MNITDKTIVAALGETDFAISSGSKKWMKRALKAALSTVEQTPGGPAPQYHVVPCPCTLIEQDEDCPIGYPSMICGVCKGTGNTTSDQVTALACEMIKIASDIGEPEDPFAAWETIDLIKSQHSQLRAALKPFARIADMEENTPAGDSTLVNIDRCREALVILAATTEGQP